MGRKRGGEKHSSLAGEPCAIRVIRPPPIKKDLIKEEGQPLSQDGWPLSFYSHRSCFFPKESGSAVRCVRWRKPKTHWRLSEPRLNPGGATGDAPGLRRR